jgi:fructose-bisphosphate aldolase class II
MSLVSLSELLNDAKQKKYGVFATNAFSFEMAEMILSAAEERKSPVILMIAEDLFEYLNPERISPAIIPMLKGAGVPVVFHLDHGTNIETVISSMSHGFNSVMYDGSRHSLEQNIQIMKRLRSLSYPSSISIEGEVGYVGGLEAEEQELENQHIDTMDFTNVEDAIKFTEETKVDALAIAVGTIHGKFRFKPDIDFNRIKIINDALDTPLVLHGSSGLTDKDFKKAISCGITKINYFTDLVTVANKKIKDIACVKKKFSYINFNKIVLDSVKEKIKEKMDLFGSTGKA